MKTNNHEAKSGTLIQTASLFFLLSVGAGLAQTNLVVNGSFETGPAGVQNFPGWDAIGPASNFSSYGVVASGVSPHVAQSGSYYAYFHGHPTDSSQDCLGQTVHLTPGATYTISYYLATDGSTLGSGAAMWAVIGTSFGIDLSQDVMLTAYLPNSAGAIAYQKFTTNYTARFATEILSFHAINGTNGFNAAGSILLDNVTLTLAAPQLNLSLAPTNKLVFTWLAATNGFRLQTNSIFGTTNWVTLTNTPATFGTSNQIILPAPASRLFYRLKLP